MTLFLSSFTNKIDKKGRVSVPANFRNALASQPFQGIIAYPSFINQCIEACGIDRIEHLSESIDALDPFAEERDAFATTILGGSTQLPFDADGRVTLPEALCAEIGITDSITFVGKGKTFEMWEPQKYQAYAAEARELARKGRAGLRLAARPKAGE